MTSQTPAPPSSVLSTLNQDGSRRWLRPRPSRGKYWRRRRAVALILLAVFTLTPYLTVNDKPAILLDIVHRQFTILGFTFLPTDTLLLALLVIGIFLTIFLCTAFFGRIWCGWACPQTIYLEFVYRPIERFFEGEPGRKTMTGRGGKAAKLVVYIVVSVALAHTFLAYFVGVKTLVHWMQRSPLEHPASFLLVAAVTALMLFDFGYFREQMCIIACPYGRFQSVLLDRGSLIVGYDRLRGEPRGRRASRDISLNVLPGTTPNGDCIDCGMCVTTCPTGIDIRGGLQMECVHCAQCIDACDTVMTKIGKPIGLIRYGSLAQLEHEPQRRWRPRVLIYPIILLVVAGAFFTVLGVRGNADVVLLRGLGQPFSILPDGKVSNQIRIKVTNRRANAASYAISIESPSGALLVSTENPLTVGAGEQRTEGILIELPRDVFDSAGLSEARLTITDGENFSKTVTYRLLGPAAHRTDEHHDDSEHRKSDGHETHDKEPADD